jgi:hypothetical protein
MKYSRFLISAVLLFGAAALLLSCLDPLNFDPNNISVEVDLHGSINITDVTSAVLLFSNQSKTVDITKVEISQDEETVVIFENEPKHLTKKAKYLTPSETSYVADIEYEYYKRGGDPEKLEYEGRGTKTITVPLPVPQRIVEVFIYRDVSGEVKIGTERDLTFDTNDTGNPLDDTMVGQGSSPAVIPPENRSRMATFVVVNRTKSQTVDSVRFEMGQSAYTMGAVRVRDKQSIALGQGTWETALRYKRNGETVTLPPVNSIIVPSNDPQSSIEHYLYFYLNRMGQYRVTEAWPPGDEGDEDIMPPDRGYGRGVIKIVNYSDSQAGKVTITNLNDETKEPLEIDSTAFEPPVPVMRNRIGYIDLVGTEDFPIEGHNRYRIDVTVTAEAGESAVTVTRQTVVRDVIVEITIEPDDLAPGGDPPDVDNPPPDYGRGTVRIINQTNSSATIIRIGEAWNFPLANPVAYYQTAGVNVIGTEDFPLEDGKIYAIKITMEKGGYQFTVTREAVIKGANVTILIAPQDVPPQVYVAGWYNGSGVHKACYWVDGQRFDLHQAVTAAVPAAIMSEASGIAVTKDGVYVSGFYVGGDGKDKACYWKNGNFFELEYPGYVVSRAVDVAVTEDGKAYVLGWGQYDVLDQPNDRMGLIWVDGEERGDITDGPGEGSGIVTADGTVYFAGQEWVDGDENLSRAIYGEIYGDYQHEIKYLPDFEKHMNYYYYDNYSAQAIGIAVAGNGAIYTAGRYWYINTPNVPAKPCYWLDGGPPVDLMSFNPPDINVQAGAVAISGTTVYIVSVNSGAAGGVPGYWENGTPRILTVPGGAPSDSLSIAVSKYGNVYTAGYYGARACYWMNMDDPVFLEEGESTAAAVTVTVR